MRDSLLPGQDPRRALRRHRERGPKRFHYTYADVAAAVGKTLRAVKADAWRGKFEPGDLVSVCTYVSRASSAHEASTSPVPTQPDACS